MDLKDIIEKTKPDEEERKKLQNVYENIKNRAENQIKKKDTEAKIELVGSSARDTWLSGERDIDIFILFPERIDKDTFERVGLQIGKEIFPDGRVKYAEHPYVNGRQKNFDIDIVPCYSVDDPREAKSSVDRTPFHNKYIKNKNIDGDEVRLLKSFARGADIYGSELKKQGFSGYLCELLILYYEDFRTVVENASREWSPQIFIDFKDHAEKEFDDKLVVVDPIDPSRNVAAVVSDESLAKFIHWCRKFEDNPQKELFCPTDPISMTEKEFYKQLEKRETDIISVVFNSPNIVEDKLYPQLRKTESSLVNELERNGFDVIRSKVMANDECVILIELNIAKQSNVDKHLGPPIYIKEHAEQFKKKWENQKSYTGPYIEGDRYIVERSRKYITAEELIEEKIYDIGSGKNIEKEIKEEYSILKNEECCNLLENFGKEFNTYFNPLILNR